MNYLWMSKPTKISIFNLERILSSSRITTAKLAIFYLNKIKLKAIKLERVKTFKRLKLQFLVL